MPALTVAPPTLPATRADVYALLDEWLVSVAQRVAAGELSAATSQTYQAGVSRFVAWAESHPAVSPALILDWKAALLSAGSRPNTVNTWLAGVRAFFAWATSNNRLTHNPAAGVHGARRKGTTRRHLREALTPAEVRGVLIAPDVSTPAGKRDSALLHLMAYTGARAIELHRADIAHVRTEGRHIVLAVRGKGRVEADEILVIAHPGAEAALHAWLAQRGDAPGPLFTSLSNRSRAGRLSLRSIRQLVKAHFATAGVYGERKTTHSLRHTAITSAVQHGASLHKAQGMARHASVATTMIYFHEVDRVTDPAEKYINYDD